MLDSILSFILGAVSKFFRQIINIVTYPLLYALKLFIPNFNSFFSAANDFIYNYLFKRC